MCKLKIKKNPKKAGEEISKNTKEYTNIRVYCTLHIANREIKKVEVFPTSSAQIIKALKEPVRQRRKVKHAVYKHTGNITFDTVKKIAENMKERKSLSRELKGTIKEVLGSCVAVGITVDGKSPKEVTKEVEEGVYQF
jgi:large subunit ribosomal protein L12e